VQEPAWLREDVVRAIQRRQLAEHGGREGVRGPGLLSSALARPRQLLAYAEPPPDLADLSTAYAFGILRNHPFIDGNKRTALVVARTFLRLNGQDLAASSVAKYRAVIRLAEGQLSEEEFAQWVREHPTLKPPADPAVP
jgi:death on curing protein